MQSSNTQYSPIESILFEMGSPATLFLIKKADKENLFSNLIMMKPKKIHTCRIEFKL